MPEKNAQFQNAQCIKTPNATKRPVQQKAQFQNTQCYKTPKCYEHPMLQNIQNKVKDSILFNI